MFEQDVIETIITSMVLRPQLRSPDAKLVANDTIACFLELRARQCREPRNRSIRASDHGRHQNKLEAAPPTAAWPQALN